MLNELWQKAQKKTHINEHLQLNNEESMTVKGHIKCNNFLCQFHSKSGTEISKIFQGLEVRTMKLCFPCIAPAFFRNT